MLCKDTGEDISSCVCNYKPVSISILGHNNLYCVSQTSQRPKQHIYPETPLILFKKQCIDSNNEEVYFLLIDNKVILITFYSINVLSSFSWVDSILLNCQNANTVSNHL